MEPALSVTGAKSLNPFDDDVDSELLDFSVETVRENGIPSPVQHLENCCNMIEDLLRTKITDPFAVEELREHFTTVKKALIKDCPELQGQIGPCLQYILNEDVIENMYVFSTKQRVYGKEIRIILFKFFTEVFSRSSQPLLIHQQILRPFRKLLRVYEVEGTKDPELSASLVPLLHTMCILMQENQSLLDLFFEFRINMPSQFLVFSPLLPHMHVSGDVGNRARDAILLCLSLADQLPGSHLTQFIATDSNFCQVWGRWGSRRVGEQEGGRESRAARKEGLEGEGRRGNRREGEKDRGLGGREGGGGAGGKERQLGGIIGRGRGRLRGRVCNVLPVRVIVPTSTVSSPANRSLPLV